MLHRSYFSPCNFLDTIDETISILQTSCLVCLPRLTVLINRFCCWICSQRLLQYPIVSTPVPSSSPSQSLILNELHILINMWRRVITQAVLDYYALQNNTKQRRLVVENHVSFNRPGQLYFSSFVAFSELFLFSPNISRKADLQFHVFIYYCPKTMLSLNSIQ